MKLPMYLPYLLILLPMLGTLYDEKNHNEWFCFWVLTTVFFCAYYIIIDRTAVSLFLGMYLLITIDCMRIQNE